MTRFILFSMLLSLGLSTIQAQNTRSLKGVTLGSYIGTETIGFHTSVSSYPGSLVASTYKGKVHSILWAMDTDSYLPSPESLANFILDVGEFYNISLTGTLHKSDNKSTWTYETDELIISVIVDYTNISMEDYHNYPVIMLYLGDKKLIKLSQTQNF